MSPPNSNKKNCKITNLPCMSLLAKLVAQQSGQLAKVSRIGTQPLVHVKKKIASVVFEMARDMSA